MAEMETYHGRINKSHPPFPIIGQMNQAHNFVSVPFRGIPFTPSDLRSAVVSLPNCFARPHTTLQTLRVSESGLLAENIETQAVQCCRTLGAGTRTTFYITDV